MAEMNWITACLFGWNVRFHSVSWWKMMMKKKKLFMVYFSEFRLISWNMCAGSVYQIKICPHTANLANGLSEMLLCILSMICWFSTLLFIGSSDEYVASISMFFTKCFLMFFSLHLSIKIYRFEVSQKCTNWTLFENRNSKRHFRWSMFTDLHRDMLWN